MNMEDIKDLKKDSSFEEIIKMEEQHLIQFHEFSSQTDKNKVCTQSIIFILIHCLVCSVSLYTKFTQRKTFVFSFISFEMYYCSRIPFIKIQEIILLGIKR